MIETVRATKAWTDYLAMGPTRGLEALQRRYRTEKAHGQRVPTTRMATLADWSRHFGWQAKLLAIATAEAKVAEDREAAYRRSILEDGYGLAWERVKTLKDLAAVLLGDLTTGERRWVTEPKALGSGPTMQVVDIERFNAQEVEQLRGVLDDIAKEKQERKQVRVLTGDKNNPVYTEQTADDAAVRVAELSYCGSLGIKPASLGGQILDDHPPD